MKQLSIFPSCNTEKAKWTLYIDGASRGNPGQAAAGVFLLKNNQEIAKNGYFLGTKTNNQAEYYALIYGLRLLREHMPQMHDHLIIYSDSELMVRQMNGTYKIKNADLKELHAHAVALLAGLNYDIEHVRREKNTVADKLANRALDTKNSKSA